MSTRVLFATVLVMSIVSSTTLGAAFFVGSANGAAYFFGGPPQSNGNAGSFGSSYAGGSGSQQASAFTPGGTAFVGQYAVASGAQSNASGVQSQVMRGSMHQGVAKFGGVGEVTGAQSGTVQMNRPTYGGFQGNFATGTQMTTMLGAGYGTASQSLCVGTAQVRVP